MTTIGQRVTPNNAAALRNRTRPDRKAMDTMDAMATAQGWEVVRDSTHTGQPRSVYTRGPWSLSVLWNSAGHGVAAQRTNAFLRGRDKCEPPAGQGGQWRDNIQRSQAVFRWLGHQLYDEGLR